MAVMTTCLFSWKPTEAPETEGEDTLNTSLLAFCVTLAGLPGTGPGLAHSTGGFARMRSSWNSLLPACEEMDEVETEFAALDCAP